MFKRLRDILILLVLAYFALYFINSEATTVINEQVLDLFKTKTESSETEKQVNQLSDSELDESQIYTSLDQAMQAPGNVKKLDLSNQNLKEIPAEVFKFSKLQSLNLSNNQISQLPDQIQVLESLQELDISNNQLNTVSSKIDDLSFLKKLNLSNNQLVDIPEVLSNLRVLEELNLANNQKLNFKKVLNDLGYSRNLKKLTLQNQTPEVQKEINALKKLLPTISVD
ncbi:MAG: leucine-rich repeat domain-containing protein [Thermoflexibacter sp.]|nr:leucine-rich repeat domain-containing protein [Thermoflexibacter sp.]